MKIRKCVLLVSLRRRRRCCCRHLDEAPAVLEVQKKMIPQRLLREDLRDARRDRAEIAPRIRRDRAEIAPRIRRGRAFGLPITTSPYFARVSATLRRLESLRKPIPCDSFARTHESIM